MVEFGSAGKESSLNFCKHVAALGLDVDKGLSEKIELLLGKTELEFLQENFFFLCFFKTHSRQKASKHFKA